MTSQPPQRILPIHAPDEYVLPGRPAGAPAAALDAHRQTQFLLGGELDLFTEAMNLQLRLLRDAYPSRFRSHALAAVVALWSRVYFYLADGLSLAMRGSYPSVLPLLRAACESIAAQEALRTGSMQEHHRWLTAALQPDETHKAIAFDLGLFFSGETLAQDDVLRRVYRPAADLARPNFGATLLQVAPESSPGRLAVLFGDASFHLGWAELVLGWLLGLAARQVKVVIDAADIFPVAQEARSAYEALQGRVDAVLARRDRCRMEEAADGGSRRYVVHNFRRAAGAAPRRIVL